MKISVFLDKSRVPTMSDVEKKLKDAYAVWGHLLQYLEHRYGTLTNEWKYYSKTSGWCYRIAGSKRNIVFLSPNQGCFYVNINMGENIGKKIVQSSVSKEVKTMIKEAKVYQEGIGIMITIKNIKDIDDVKTILSIRDE